ncbi:helix-turn-helix transcriptional regulator [Hyphomonas sp.]|jgi:predicted DNA-binding transcriptional regulator AlpA
MSATQPKHFDDLVDIKTVMRVLKRSRASIYRDIKNQVFPHPVKVRGSSRWRSSEIHEYIENLPRANDL